MPDTPPIARVSARTLLVDQDDRILLLRYRVVPDDDSAGHGWCTPGGGVNDGEALPETVATEVDTGRMEDLERSYHAGHRWWTVDEIEASGEAITPWGLAGLLRDLVAGRVPAEPVRLPWHR